MDKQTALVTGGTLGIGRAIALSLAKDGYHVVINCRKPGKASEETLEEIKKVGGSVELLCFDVAKKEAGAVVSAWVEAHGPFYILINNAGIKADSLLVWMKDEEWSSVIDTNLNGFYNITRPVIKEMLLKRAGRVINIVSTAGQAGMAGQVNYSAAKAGVIGATKALAAEVAKRGVTVNAVAPGFIATGMLDGLPLEQIIKKIPAGRLGKPDEVAAVVSFLCSDSAGYITGAVIPVNGGIYM
jgi:3-oxoacyl-[acyl-carrier protein] reductase